MKESRFLIIPKSNNFRDIINVKEITNELKKKGHDCITLTSQISDKNLEFILEEEKFNYVFRVNNGKPEKVNKNIRFISWISDISKIDECLHNYNENDLIYTLKKNPSDNKKLKINQMLGAASYFKNIPKISHYESVTKNDQPFQQIDISLISNYTKIDLFNGSIEIINEANIKNLERHKYFHKLLNNLEDKYITEVYSLINYSNLSKFKNVKYKGEINNFNYFFEIFRRSKFNILFESEFLDFNTNFFNILLVEGTLIFNDKLLNKIEHYLDLDEDSSNYFLNYNNPESFKSNISNYIDNFNERIQMGKKSSKLISKKHLYKNRIEQLIKDLD